MPPVVYGGCAQVLHLTKCGSGKSHSFYCGLAARCTDSVSPGTLMNYSQVQMMSWDGKTKRACSRRLSVAQTRYWTLFKTSSPLALFLIGGTGTNSFIFPLLKILESYKEHTLTCYIHSLWARRDIDVVTHPMRGGAPFQGLVQI